MLKAGDYMMNNGEISLHPGNLSFAEAIYAEYLTSPESVSAEWRAYFADWNEPAETNGHSANGHQTNGFSPPAVHSKSANGSSNGTQNGSVTARLGPSFRPASMFNAMGTGIAQNFAAEQVVAAGPAEIPVVPKSEHESFAAMQDRVDQLVRAHRERGHMVARIDPLNLPRDYPPEIDPEFYGFTPEDEARTFACETLSPGKMMPLSDILSQLRETYCRTVGVQFMHIDELDVRLWLQHYMESTRNRLALGRDEQVRLLTRLTDASIFEEFIRRKFVGAKSFSLDGSESLIPLLDRAIEKAAAQGTEEVVIGMAHRGRLNVLANIIGKSPREIFREFEDRDPDLHIGGGDVKYHLGYANDFETASGKKVHLALSFNPSHLEIVNPVAQGRLRAKMSRWKSEVEGETRVGPDKGLCLLIHGDAAFAGEGVVQETLNLSQLKPYSVGGTLHVIVNNQIGFTTAPSESRSTPYATDVARMLQSPVFHVNGEDPEAVAAVVNLALDFRHKFHRDIVIDMYGYRRLGHNETDEPSFTQPKMYRAIKARKPVREAYLEQLLKMGDITQQEADTIAENRREILEKELTQARSDDAYVPSHLRRTATGYQGGPEPLDTTVTAVPTERLSTLLESLTRVPAGFSPHPKIQKILDTYKVMARGEAPLNWAAGEALAYATLATEGVPVRLTGQDSERGTFSHRHAVLHDVETDETYRAFDHLAAEQAPVEIYNSPLSETAVLGFEYGYSLDCLSGLTMWEAQFGDFWNVAQPIVDQFLVSAEDKWNHLSGITMLLPHGYEGMGPEHSTARLERFMSLAAEDNIQIVYPTTPAQYFHLIRRQVLRRWRKPLIVMSPKSLLRHLECTSTLDELATGRFQRIIPDQLERPAGEVTRILLCSGKIYYELDAKRAALKRNDVAIVRYEQLYPYSPETLQEVLAPYADGTPIFWVQEEPINMGAWRHMRVFYGHTMFERLPFTHVTRPASSSPATGSSSAHKKEQEKLLNEAFA